MLCMEEGKTQCREYEDILTHHPGAKKVSCIAIVHRIFCRIYENNHRVASKNVTAYVVLDAAPMLNDFVNKNMHNETLKLTHAHLKLKHYKSHVVVP